MIPGQPINDGATTRPREIHKIPAKPIISQQIHGQPTFLGFRPTNQHSKGIDERMLFSHFCKVVTKMIPRSHILFILINIPRF